MKTDLDTLSKFWPWNTSTVAEHLSSDVLTDWCGAIQHQGDVGQQGVLGTCDFELGQVGAQSDPE